MKIWQISFPAVRETFSTLPPRPENSYLYLDDNRISIKKYLGQYKGLIRVEVKFHSLDEMNNYRRESWMETEITNSPLAFDKYLRRLSKQEFLLELNKYISKL